MDVTSLIQTAKPIIQNNIGDLRFHYVCGCNWAMYDKNQIGQQRAYDHLNKLLPKDFRKNLSMKDAQILNTEIKRILSEEIK